MDRKKISAIISLFVFVVVIILLAVWLKKQPAKEQKTFADKFSQDMQAAKNQTAAGIVKSVDAQNLTIQFGQIQIVVKINKATSVLLLDKTKKTSTGQLSDVKPGDTVTVEYNKDSMNVTTITVVKS